MNVLAIDAGLGYFSVAVASAGRTHSERSDRNDALETGLTRVARVLAAAGLELRDLDRIAVGTGPGSFTGIRIAVSFAKALAFGTGIPLVGVSSYDVLAPPDLRPPYVTLVSGRTGIVCARLTRATGPDKTACGPTVEVIERLAAARDGAVPLVLVAATEDVFPPPGEGGLTIHRVVSPAGTDPAAAIAHLASRREPAASLHALAPDYGEMPPSRCRRRTTASPPRRKNNADEAPRRHEFGPPPRRRSSGQPEPPLKPNSNRPATIGRAASRSAR